MPKYRVHCDRNEVMVEADYYKVEDGCLNMRDHRQRRTRYEWPYSETADYPITKLTFAPHAWDRIELVPPDGA